jgi:hypothetical protein
VMDNIVVKKFIDNKDAGDYDFIDNMGSEG